MSLRGIIIAGALVVFVLALVADYAWGNTIYMPNVSQRCNPCSHSVPYPTATPDIGEPPMPTAEVVR